MGDRYGPRKPLWTPPDPLAARVASLERRLKQLQEEKTLEARVADLERQIAKLEAA